MLNIYSTYVTKCKNSSGRVGNESNTVRELVSEKLSPHILNSCSCNCKSSQSDYMLPKIDFQIKKIISEVTAW